MPWEKAQLFCGVAGLLGVRAEKADTGEHLLEGWAGFVLVGLGAPEGAEGEGARFEAVGAGTTPTRSRSGGEDTDAVAEQLESEDEEEGGHDGRTVPGGPVSPGAENASGALSHEHIDGQRCEDSE